MRSRLLVTGATGTVGREVCRHLFAAGAEVLGATRHPSVAAFSDVPVSRWIRLDYDEPSEFERAFAGVEGLFLIARPGDENPETAARPLLRAARSAGVRRIVNLTALGAERRRDVRLGLVERLVEDAGFSYAHLRPNWFMQIFSAEPLATEIRAAGRLALPAGDARISYVDARDVAALAARTLLEDRFERCAYDLTGPESLTHASVAEAITAAAGCRPVVYTALEEEAARKAILSAGLSAARAERLIRFYRLVRAGHSAPVSADLENALGRPPIPFSRFASDYADAWRPNRSDSASGGQPSRAEPGASRE